MSKRAETEAKFHQSEEGNMTMNNSDRAWDELEAAGHELSKRGLDYAGIVDIVKRVVPRFELPGTREEKAAAELLTGLVNAHRSAAYLARRGNDPESAE